LFCTSCDHHLTPPPIALLLFFSTLPRPPRSPLFPYTTLFRSRATEATGRCQARVRHPLMTCWPERPRPAINPSPTGRHVISGWRSEEHTSELQSLTNLVCRLLLEKKKKLTPHTSSSHTPRHPP